MRFTRCSRVYSVRYTPYCKLHHLCLLVLLPTSYHPTAMDTHEFSTRLYPKMRLPYMSHSASDIQSYNAYTRKGKFKKRWRKPQRS